MEKVLGEGMEEKELREMHLYRFHNFFHFHLSCAKRSYSRNENS